MSVWNLYIVGHERVMFYILDFNDWFKANLEGRFNKNANTKWATIWGTIIWFSWSWRNSSIFNDQFQYPTNPQRIIANYISLYSSVNAIFEDLMSNPGAQTHLIKWVPPSNGIVKVNTDGASKGNGGAAGCGGLIRDSFGCWIAGFTRRIV